MYKRQRWGFENLNLTQERLNQLGFGQIMRPVKTSCSNHKGDDWARIVQWDGAKFKVASDWYQADKTLLDPMVKEAAAKYAKEKNITPRTCENLSLIHILLAVEHAKPGRGKLQGVG